MEASSDKGNSSWIWKSLVSTRDPIKKGIIWQIENGANIKIWGEKWLPTPSSFQVQSHLKNLPASTVMKDLLEKGGLEWNRPLIMDTF